jgi:hypothetical protein
LDRIWKKPASPSGNTFWKRAYVALCIILLCLTAGQLFIGLLNPESGMDYRVFKGAVQALNHGEDPYSLSNIRYYVGGTLPFNYPPHTLLFFWCLQIFFVFQSIWMYYIFLIALMVASGYLILTLDQNPEYLFFITLLLTGFISTFWNFYDGNKDILFLFLFAWIFYLLEKEKFWQSSIVMGLMGTVSLITIPFISIYLVVKRSITDRIKYILLSIGVMAAIFLITWWVSPSLLASYIENLWGGTSPLLDQSDRNTPTPFLMFGVLFNPMNGGITIPMLFVSLVYVSLIIGASWFVFRKNQENPLIIYSFIMLAIFMVLPRTKPYDFIILVLPLYFLFKDFGDKIKILALTVISLLPLGVWYYFLIDRTQPISYLNYLIYSYTQTFSLFLIFVIAFALEYFKPIASKKNSGTAS